MNTPAPDTITESPSTLNLEYHLVHHLAMDTVATQLTNQDHDHTGSGDHE